MAPPVSLLKCLKCGTRLELDQERCTCPRCGTHWPVTGGIPRFLQPSGDDCDEVSRSEAGELLEAARKGSWVEAVRARFSEGDDMTIEVLDLQRASWLPMMELDEDSVALDIGCGYGAITHSISRTVGELYSIEAVPERIEFTQERLRQEGIRNVHLIQASATALPFVENSFDLVVANGILEWVAERDREGNPRSVQLRFLDTVRQLLKDDGVLVIGLENRVGCSMFLGAPDHSGIPYTSLVPRPMASFMLRHTSTLHHPAKLNLKREYQTYTYTGGGYRKLLADAGFADVSCYWVYPGYNQPYHLTPVAKPRWLRDRFLDVLDHPGSAPRQSLSRRLKRVIARSPLRGLLLQEFVLVASKRLVRRTKLRAWLRERLESGRACGGGAAGSQTTIWALDTKPFFHKTVMQLADGGTGRDVAFLKVGVEPGGSANALQTEMTNLAKIRSVLQERVSHSIAVPQELGMLRVGNTLYCLESAAGGTRLARAVHRPGYFANARRVEHDFGRIVDGVVDLTEALQTVSGAGAIDPGWHELPEDLGSFPERLAGFEDARYFRRSSTGSRAGWIQHGDLSVENIFLDRQTGRIEVVDWADLAAGFPPLYDLFGLFFSTGYLPLTAETVRFPTEEDRWIASFEAIFFNDTDFGRIAGTLMLHACERMDIPPAMIPALLIDFLLFRSHYYSARSAVQRRVHLRLLERAGDRSVFGRFPIGDPSPPPSRRRPRRVWPEATIGRPATVRRVSDRAMEIRGADSWAGGVDRRNEV
jgi:SAM-dependent methyltransferase/uncharacterized protein YbaR (Trm112 family)